MAKIRHLLWQQIKDRFISQAFRQLAQAIADLEDHDSFPQGGIIISLGEACPSGFTEVSELAGYHVRGVPSGGSVGDVIGADSVSQMSGNNDDFYSDGMRGGSTPMAKSPHKHLLSFDIIPLSKYVLFCRKD